MDWLCCNKCYRLMGTTEKNFFMTQCGHVFCESCISMAPTKCFVCETLDFRSLKLTRPPKLETHLNYFSPASDFVQEMQKMMEFHDEQLAISLQGCEVTEKKYGKLKKCYAELRKQYDERRCRYAELEMYHAELKRELIRETQLLDEQEQRQQTQRSDNSSTSRQMEVCKTTQQRPNFSDGGEHRQSRSHRSGNSMTRHVDIPADASMSQEQRWIVVGASRTPGNCYNPSPAFSNPSYTPATSISTSDSGCETTTLSTPSTIRHGDFVVPTTQRVPRSVASVRRRSRTLPRLGAPSRSHDL